MRSIATSIILLSAFQNTTATDWILPDPITYEWTAKETQKLMSCDFKDTSVREILDYMGSTMNVRVPLKHDLPDEVLNQKVTWKFKDMVWIIFVGKIADLTDSDIQIEKGVIRLIHKKTKKPNKA